MYNSSTEVNEASHGCWSNTGKSGGYGSKPWQNKDKKPWNNNSKPYQSNDKKPWQVEDKKYWQHKDKKPWQNKDSKPKDACITLTKDVKYFCPTGYDDGIFQTVVTLLHEKIQ